METTYIQEPLLHLEKPGLGGYIHISYDHSVTLDKSRQSRDYFISSGLTYGLHTATTSMQLFNILEIFGLLHNVNKLLYIIL